MSRAVPQRPSRTVLGDIPDGIRLLDDIVDLEDVLIVDLPQFLVDLLLFGDVIGVTHALLNPSYRQALLQLRIEHPEDLHSP